jgi:hypothetical protein
MSKLFKISLNSNNEINPTMMEDIIKINSIIVSLHCFICATDFDKSLFDPYFLKVMFFLNISIIIYWMFIRKNKIENINDTSSEL